MVVAAAPFLIFPRGPLPWFGLGLLLASRLVRGLGSRGWLTRTSLDRPMAIIFLMALVSLYVSVDLALSMPKFYGITLGMFIYYATVGNVSSQRHFSLGVGFLVVSVFAVSMLGLIGTEWSVGKFPVLQSVYSRIPRLIREIQTSMGPANGIHPNELGGMLALLLPLPIALILGAPLSVLKKAVLGMIILFGLGVLALSASRSSVIGVTVAVLGLLIWRRRRAGITLAVVAAAALGLVVSFDKDLILDFLLRVDSISRIPSTEVLSARQEIWDRAIYMIEDFPFTGIGLNTFPVVLGQLYPLFMVSPDVLIAHAHNIFLQTAVDLGLGGLLAFCGLLACLAYAGWRTCQQAGASERNRNSVSGDGSAGLLLQTAVGGLLAGVLSYLVFGLTDNISLGAKPMFLMWLMMGLIVVAQRLVNDTKADKAIGAAKLSAVVRRLGSLGDTYWIFVYLCVVMGYLVVGLRISGWTP